MESLRVTSTRHNAELDRLAREAGVTRSVPKAEEVSIEAEAEAAVAVSSEQEQEELAVGEDFARPTLVRRSRL
jgi:hypothetical protein